MGSLSKLSVLFLTTEGCGRQRDILRMAIQVGVGLAKGIVAITGMRVVRGMRHEVCTHRSLFNLLADLQEMLRRDCLVSKAIMPEPAGGAVLTAMMPVEGEVRLLDGGRQRVGVWNFHQ